MPARIDYFYSVMSGFAYLGEPTLRRLAVATGARINYRPLDILTLFAEAGVTAPAAQSPARRAYRDIELRRWADIRGLPINLAPRYWPVDAKPASRLVYASQSLKLDPGILSSAFLKAVWADDRDIADPAARTDIVHACHSQDAERLFDLAEQETTQAALVDATADAVRLGVIGSPTYIVDGEMFFGQDRLGLVAERLGASG